MVLWKIVGFVDIIAALILWFGVPGAILGITAKIIAVIVLVVGVHSMFN